MKLHSALLRSLLAAVLLPVLFVFALLGADIDVQPAKSDINDAVVSEKSFEESDRGLVAEPLWDPSEEAVNEITESPASSTTASAAYKTSEEILAEISEKSGQTFLDSEVVSENIIEEIPEEGASELASLSEPLREEIPVMASEAISLYEKVPAMEPSLMVRGEPVDEQSELEQLVKIVGRIVPERQPLGRRRHLYRWVLQTDDGQRIPLKSSIRLLQEVRAEDALEGFVTVSGKFATSGFNKDLRFLTVESVLPAPSLSSTASPSAALASDTLNVSLEPASATGDIASSSQGIATASLPVTD